MFWSRTGVRPGELIALKWEDVDYFNKTVSVRRTRAHGGFDGPPKTPSSERDLTLRPAVVDALKRQEARTSLMGSYIWMVNGRQITNHMIGRKFSYCLKLAGIKTRPPSQMRHTFATLHIAAGESISWVAQMLGHSSVKMTLEKYNRYVPNLARDDGSAFESVAEKGNIKVIKSVNG